MRASRSASRLPPRSGGCFAAAPALATAIPVPADATRHPGLVGWAGESAPEENDMTDPTGGCLCGDVRFRLTGPPYEVDYCHCHSCRKHTGAPVSVFADCKGGIVEFTKGAPTLYESSPGVRRGFCARCGSVDLRDGCAARRDPRPHRRAGPTGGLSASRQGVLCGRARSVVADQGGDGIRPASTRPVRADLFRLVR